MSVGRWIVVGGLVVVGCKPSDAGVPMVEGGEDRVAGDGAKVDVGGGGVERVVDAPVGVEWSLPVVEQPGDVEIDRSVLLDAPGRYEHVTLRAGLPVGARFEDLVYEGNNKNFRGKLGGEGLYRSGDATAEDWRRWVAGVRGMIVLRDSLFSQQDHPVLQEPRALMMPPSWVSVAVAATMDGQTLVGPRVAELEDDAGWGSAKTAAERFGSFPPSDRLFRESALPLTGEEPSPGQHARTRNARRSVIALAAAAEAMVQAQAGGPEMVADAGAAWITASDVTYFGTVLRAKTIPIFVENPNEHEARDEGKGMGVWGVELRDDAVTLARDRVYARRLLDGPLGVERYDLRHDAERARAIALLETLIPAGSRGHPVWLWINGGSDGHGKGEPAIPYVAAFQQAIEAADIETSRLVLLSKPSVRPRGAEAQATLDAFADETRALGIPASVQLNTRAARRLLAE